MLRKRENRVAHRRDKSSSKGHSDSGQHPFADLFHIFLVGLSETLTFGRYRAFYE